MGRTIIAVLFCLATGASLAWAGPPFSVPGPAADSPSDVLDDVITGEMRKRHVAGLSLAIIQDGKIVTARGYGVTERAGDSQVTTATLFKAGLDQQVGIGPGARCGWWSKASWPWMKMLMPASSPGGCR